MSELQNELRRKGRIEIGDKLMLYGGEWRLLSIGDTYIGHTEGDEPEILTVRRIEVQKRPAHKGPVGKIYPKERKKKLYNLEEVVKVTFMDNPNLDKENKTNEHKSIEPDRVDVRREVRPAGKPRTTPKPRAPRLDRPVPGPPRRGGRTDYSSAAVPNKPESGNGGSANPGS